MPAYPDEVVLLRQLRPLHEPAPDPDALERILAERAPRPRRPRRLVLAVAALAVLVVSTARMSGTRAPARRRTRSGRRPAPARSAC